MTPKLYSALNNRWLGVISDHTADPGDLSDRIAGSGAISDRTADSGDLSDRIAGVGILSSSTGSESQKVFDVMQSSNQQGALRNSVSSEDSWVDNHIKRAEIISHYGDAFKKFDWLIYLIASFILFGISLLAYHFFGAETTIVSFCTQALAGAIYLLRKKTS